MLGTRNFLFNWLRVTCQNFKESLFEKYRMNNKVLKITTAVFTSCYNHPILENNKVKAISVNSKNNSISSACYGKGRLSRGKFYNIRKMINTKYAILILINCQLFINSLFSFMSLSLKYQFWSCLQRFSSTRKPLNQFVLSFKTLEL